VARVLFVHAHPDDEAIFTGGTMALLAAAGHRVILIVATNGELGSPPAGVADVDLRLAHPSAVGATGPAALGPVAAHRRAEVEQAAELLGIARVEWLGYRDSGMAGDVANADPLCLWQADPGEVANQIAGFALDEACEAIVTYDDRGIYGHPDHVQVHRAGVLATTLAGVPDLYESTVDREYLHFVESHLVEEAILGSDLGLVRSHLGRATVEVTTTVDVRSVLDRKRKAMAAHASQIPESASALRLPEAEFAAVYGFEWYVRRGPKGLIESL
jgi:LmbE family N-acetylglucosaminyl deacetylase